MSDSELAERLGKAWDAYDANKPSRAWVWSFFWWYPFWWSRRGPIRHPRAYRFFTALSGSNGEPGDVLVAALVSGKRAQRWLWRDRGTNAHLALCEVRDITDEIERRIAEKKQNAGTVS